MIGCIGIVGHEERAQLRWFLIDPLYRGVGLGKKLLTYALEFARERGYLSGYNQRFGESDWFISESRLCESKRKAQQLMERGANGIRVFHGFKLTGY